MVAGAKKMRSQGARNLRRIEGFCGVWRRETCIGCELVSHKGGFNHEWSNER